MRAIEEVELKERSDKHNMRDEEIRQVQVLGRGTSSTLAMLNLTYMVFSY